MAAPGSIVSDRVAIASVIRVGRHPPDRAQDLVAVEAPLAIELRSEDGATSRSFGVFMRTPGDDPDFVLGLLYAEGIIRVRDDVRSIEQRAPAGDDAAEAIDVTVSSAIALPSLSIDRAVMASSACGLCGRLSLDGLDRIGTQSASSPMIALAPEMIAALPAALRAHQTVFAETGGLHAAGFFDWTGQFLSLREDVGRHNAVDKLVGATLAAGKLPARDRILVVSGRVAFEIVQKTVMAAVPVLVAVGAPSSLAIDAARAAQITLIGFARDGRFNIYSGQERVADT